MGMVPQRNQQLMNGELGLGRDKTAWEMKPRVADHSQKLVREILILIVPE